MTTPYRKAFHLCRTKFCRRKRGKKSPCCSKCAMRQWRANNPIKALLAHLRWRATKKRLDFDLPFRWFARLLAASGYDRTLHHIDRIRSWEGYVKGNVQVLEGVENIAKGNRERWVVERPF